MLATCEYLSFSVSIPQMRGINVSSQFVSCYFTTNILLLQLLIFPKLEIEELKRLEVVLTLTVIYKYITVVNYKCAIKIFANIIINCLF